jgi:hypothetical protein
MRTSPLGGLTRAASRSTLVRCIIAPASLVVPLGVHFSERCAFLEHVSGSAQHR